MSVDHTQMSDETIMRNLRNTIIGFVSFTVLMAIVVWAVMG